MAQNITLLGASYSGVPAVELPKTGGGTARFTDVSDSTVVADKLANGYTAYNASGTIVNGTGKFGSAYQDSNGYVVIEPDESSAPQGSLNVTTNGTYDVTNYAGVNIKIGDYIPFLDGRQHIWVHIINLNDNIAAINLSSVSSSNANIDWGDGEIETVTSPSSGLRTHRYDKIGLYSISVSGINLSELGKNNGLPYGHLIEAIEFNNRSSSSVCQELPCVKYVYWADNITTTGLYSDYNQFTKCYSLQYVRLSPRSTWISGLMFSDCYNLIQVDNLDNITNIGNGAFRNCKKLRLSSLPESLVEIQESAFSGCSSVNFSQLPTGITNIPQNAFQSCENITLTNLPNGVTSIGDYAFRYCKNIPSISCEGIITKLGTYAFNGSSSSPMSLTSASFPNMALTSDISTVFGNATAASACQFLEFCDIGSTVGITVSAFANCYALETLVLRKTDTVCALTGITAFVNTPMRGYNSKTGKVYVPSALISSYQTATNWSTLYNDGTVTFIAIEGSEYERN